MASGRVAVALDPQSAEARYGYGLALSADGRPLEAARELEKATAGAPGRAEPLRALAAAYAAAQDRRAREAYERLVAIEPDRVVTRVRFAELLWSEGGGPAGNRQMEEALRIAPARVELRTSYAESLLEQERFDDAARELQKARELGDGGPATLALLGSALAQGGKAEEAVLVLEEAAGASASDAGVRHELGRLLLSLGRAGEARERLSQASRLSPGSAGVWLDLGRAEEASGDLAAAERAYRKAVSLAPTLATPHYALGRLLARQGQREEAARELAAHRSLYDRARKKVEETGALQAETALAWSELQKGKTSEALARFAALPETADTILGKATALSRLGRHAEAVAALERARAIEPENPRVAARLAAERFRAAEEK